MKTAIKPEPKLRNCFSLPHRSCLSTNRLSTRVLDVVLDSSAFSDLCRKWFALKMVIQCALVLQLVRPIDIKNSSAELFLPLERNYFVTFKCLARRGCLTVFAACNSKRVTKPWALSPLATAHLSIRGIASLITRRSAQSRFRKVQIHVAKARKSWSALKVSWSVQFWERAEKRESGFEFIATDRLLPPDFAVSASACKSRI